MSASRIRALDLRPYMHEPMFHAPRGSDMSTSRIRAPDLRLCVYLARRSRAIPRLAFRRRLITSAHRIVGLGSPPMTRCAYQRVPHSLGITLASNPFRRTTRTPIGSVRAGNWARLSFSSHTPIGCESQMNDVNLHPLDGTGLASVRKKPRHQVRH